MVMMMMIYFSRLAYISCIYDCCCPKDQAKNQRSPKLNICLIESISFCNFRVSFTTLIHVSMNFVTFYRKKKIRDNMCIKFTFLLKALYIEENTLRKREKSDELK